MMLVDLHFWLPASVAGRANSIPFHAFLLLYQTQDFGLQVEHRGLGEIQIFNLRD
jgi:hypothetical protein